MSDQSNEIDALEAEEDGAIIPDGFSTPLMNLYSFPNPLEGLPESHICQCFIEIGEKHELKFRESWEKLQQLLRRISPCELLATCSFYSLFKCVDSEEMVSDGDYSQAHIELLQSAALTIPAAEIGNEPALQQYVFSALEASKECAESYGLAHYKEIAQAPEENRKGRALILGARMHSQLLRNWASPQHMHTIVDELFAPFANEMTNFAGLSVADFLNVVNGIRSTVENRVNEFMRRLFEIMSNKDINSLVEESIAFFEQSEDMITETVKFFESQNASLDQVRAMLLSYSHSHLPRMFTFSISDICGFCDVEVADGRIAKLASQLCLSFGDLEDKPAELLSLQSPITIQPLIRVNDETFFVPIPGLLHSYSLQILESLVSKDEKLKDKYHRRRSQYLETEIEQILRGTFPDATVLSQAFWKSDDGKEYESDFVVKLGSYLIILEAKSNRISDSAKRGSLQRLHRDLGRLVSAPAEQAERLASALTASSDPVTLKSKKLGIAELEIDTKEIHQVICCSVTLDSLPVGTLCWLDAVQAGLVPEESRPVIHMTLADLIVVFETLDSQAKRLHYLSRRAIWEKHVRYFADEEDILVYYLSEGLPVLVDDNGQVVSLHLYGRSDELRRYYMSAWVDPETTVSRPNRILTDWFQGLVDKVESLEEDHRWDLLNVILDVPYRDQIEVEKKVIESTKLVREKGNDCEESGLMYRPTSSEQQNTIVVFTYKDLTTDERNTKAEALIVQAHNETDANQVVLFGRDIDRQGFPYDLLMFSNGVYMKE